MSSCLCLSHSSFNGGAENSHVQLCLRLCNSTATLPATLPATLRLCLQLCNSTATLLATPPATLPATHCLRLTATLLATLSATDTCNSSSNGGAYSDSLPATHCLRLCNSTPDLAIVLNGPLTYGGTALDYPAAIDLPEFPSSGESWLVAAIAMDNPYCSCKLTRVRIAGESFSLPQLKTDDSANAAGRTNRAMPPLYYAVAECSGMEGEGTIRF